jgi:long-subunit acyl-CoA synthetase (AMP-forming)
MKSKNIIKAFFRKFSKKQQKQVIQENIYLDKWERLKKLPDPYIGDIFIEGKTEEIAIALVHCDEKTRKRFLEFSKAYTKHRRLEELINEHSNISKDISDKMKAHISNFSGLGRAGYIQYTNFS